MDKINFQNGVTKVNADTFNTFQNNIEESVVAVSPTQPTTNEKVWFKKGKNLLDKNNYITDSKGYIGFVVNLEAGKTYTMSSNLPIIAKFAKQSNLSDNTVGPQNWEPFTSWTFVAGQNTDNYLNNIVYIGNNEKKLQTNVESYSSYNIQIEEGSTATTYEEYVESTVYVKNASGVFEEFYNKNFFKTEKLVITSKLSGFNVTGYRFGKLCFIFFDGAAENLSQTWTAYKLCEITGVTAAGAISSTFVNQVGQSGDVTILSGSNVINLNYRSVTPVTKNSWIRGQLLFVCK